MSASSDSSTGAAAPGLADVDATAAMSFGDRFMSDLAAGMTACMCALGDRLGLFRVLAEEGPSTSSELARRAQVDERYVREWLRAMYSADYLTCTPPNRYGLPPERALVLADQASPFYVGAIAQMVPAFMSVLESITRGFRTGGGTAPDDYPRAMYETMWQMSGKWLELMLVEQWIPAVDGLFERLRDGADVAHVNCGGGDALVLLGKAFPNSRIAGYDAFSLNTDRAAAAVAAGGLENVRVVLGDPVEKLSGKHDLVLMLDTLHLAADPVQLLKAVRDCMRDDGVFLLLETSAADQHHNNAGPTATFLYATSTVYSVPLTREASAECLGMMGLPHGVLARLCAAAGLDLRRTLFDPTPFNTLYEIRPDAGRMD